MIEEFLTPQMLTTVGFPIVAYMLLYFRMEKLIKENSQMIRSLTELIKRNI